MTIDNFLLGCGIGFLFMYLLGRLLFNLAPSCAPKEIGVLRAICKSLFSPLPRVGSIWEMRDNSCNPWEPRRTVTVVDVKPGWVRYQMPGCTSSSCELHIFHHNYGLVENESRNS